MQEKLHIVLAASEVVPYAKTGGLADVSGALPKALAELGCQVSLIMPRYNSIKTGRLLLERLTVPFAFGEKQCAIWLDEQGGVPVYFIDAPEYFWRDTLYGERDDAERFAFFSRAVLEFFHQTQNHVDVFHCNDWMTGLLPVYLRTNYAKDSFYAQTASILTIHNLAFQGMFSSSSLSYFGLDPNLYHGSKGLEFSNVASSLKGGILYADAITTVSRRYAQEIQTQEHGFRMEGLLRMRRDSLIGILNGIDVDEWNPASDSYTIAHYDATNLAGKQLCKQDLLARFGLPLDLSRPTIGLISRMTDQKGFDLIIKVIDRILETRANFVLLGSGADFYERFFQAVRDSRPDRVGVYFGLNNRLAHQIEAGADIFLMPSYYEPCGLNQMYSLRYGTIPIVRATGGLDDTVDNFDRTRMLGNGFKFADYNAEQLLERVYEALITYNEPDIWRQLMINGMTQDFSWTRSAKQYIEVYQTVRQRYN